MSSLAGSSRRVRQLGADFCIFGREGARSHGDVAVVVLGLGGRIYGTVSGPAKVLRPQVGELRQVAQVVGPPRCRRRGPIGRRPSPATARPPYEPLHYFIVDGADRQSRPQRPTRPRLTGRVLRKYYACRMSEVASRKLRNETAGLLRRVQAGEDITVTLNGRPVARLVPFEPARRRWLSREQLMRKMRRAQADSGLRDDLAALAGDTTDDLDPLR